MPWTASFANGPLEGERRMDGPYWRHLWFALDGDRWTLALVGDGDGDDIELGADTCHYVRDELASMLEPPEIAGAYKGSAIFTLAHAAKESALALRGQSQQACRHAATIQADAHRVRDAARAAREQRAVTTPSWT